MRRDRGRWPASDGLPELWGEQRPWRIEQPPPELSEWRPVAGASWVAPGGDVGDGRRPAEEWRPELGQQSRRSWQARR